MSVHANAPSTDLTPTVRRLSETEVLVTGSEALHAWREAHRLYVPGYEYAPRYKMFLKIVERLRVQGHDQQSAERAAAVKAWDGTWAPGRWCRRNADGTYELRCSRGLRQRIVGAQGYDPALMAEALVYLRGHPRCAELRDYQQEAFLRAVTEEWGRLALATNAGKGAVIAMLADFAAQREKPVLICCDEVAVFDALQGELQAWAGISPGLVKAGVKEPGAGLIHLAMIPTLARRLNTTEDEDGRRWRAWVASHTMLLLDEADKATAAGWRSILSAAKGTRWRVGFSGTFPAAYTYEDWRLEESIGPVLATARNMELVERGISARPTVTLAGFDATPALCPPPRWEDWKAMSGPTRRLWAYEKGLVYNLERHRFVSSLIRPQVPTAIVINRVDHGERLQETIPGSVFLDGSDSEQGRIAALEKFREGKFHVLIVTKILDRGTNRLGFARDVIFASGEGSDRQTLQRIGRGLRRTDGKEALRVVDVIDRVEVGEATDHASRRLRMMASYLHRAARSRMDLYASEGFEVEATR